MSGEGTFKLVTDDTEVNKKGPASYANPCHIFGCGEKQNPANAKRVIALAEGDQMTKSDLVKELAFRAKITHVVADKVVNAIFNSMPETLVAGNRIVVRGFGSLEIREYACYAGRNPKNGETVMVIWP